MAIDLSTSKLHVIVSISWRLRQEATQRLVAGWDGPVKRLDDPDLDAILLSLDTPSLFEPPALYVIGGSERWVRRYKDALKALAGVPSAGGVIVLALAKLPGNETLGRALAKTSYLQREDVPSGRELQPWLIQRLGGHPQGCERPRDVAEELLQHRGGDIDGLLAAIDQVALHAGDDPITVAGVRAVIAGEAEVPIWEFTGALLGGRGDKAVRLLHAGRGLDPHQALGALANEIRRCLCCLVAADDAEAAALAGLRGRPNLYYTRQRASELGRACLTRLLNGVVQAQRELRRTGTDADAVMEMLILNAQRVIRLGRG